MKKPKPTMSAMFGGGVQGGFLGMPLMTPGISEKADIVVLGAPCATPYPSVGPYCADAPEAIRAALGWPGALDHYDFDLTGKVLADGVRAVDWSNLAFHEADFSTNREEIRAAVRLALDAGSVPIVLGGDDSIPIPVLQAYEDHGPITVFQFDAHIDWRDQVAGEKMGLSSNMRRASEMDWVKNIIQVGARGIGSARPEDYKDAINWGSKLFPMEAMLENGIEPILNAVPKDVPVFVTFDIDVMDPSVVPAVIGPAPGGMHYWQAVTLLKGLAKRARVVGFDLVELMPKNDVGGSGALVAARLVAVMLGLISRQIGER
ncbi:MAG: arginase family protein [bacterium]